ncbi:MAG TPA: helix-turn-helix domain-containing protein [Arachidicoccus sp.]|nr:helix-turn-helix domain-containing protein [Arachidicoccus sp.]
MNSGHEAFSSSNRSQVPYQTEVILSRHLQAFKMELLFEIKQLIREQLGGPIKKWLKSHEVRKLLGVSPGTLQTLRNNGTLPSVKLGGVIYYSSDDIANTMEQLKLARMTKVRS